MTHWGCCRVPEAPAPVVIVVTDDAAYVTGQTHAEVCAVVFGARYCSCGSDVNGGHAPVFGRPTP